MATRCAVALLLAAACATPQQKTAEPAPPQQKAPPPPAQRQGIATADLDRGADPCTDFAQFSNGGWHEKNPIPASMQRWSRRWQAGESSKERLRDILDEVSRKTDWPARSVEQLVGDHYASCMDEARIDAAGLGPVKPLLTEIANVEDQRGLQQAILRLHRLGAFAPFGVGAQSDNHEPAQTIAWILAGGLGLPDRDYYFKTEPRFVEARERYVQHVARVLALAGLDGKGAQGVFELEKRLAGASLDNVALRDPAATDHRVHFAELSAYAPHFDWAAYFDAAHLPRADLNLTEPGFLRQLDAELTRTPLPEWKTYLSWQLVAFASPWLSRPFADEDFAFNQKYLAGVPDQKPRWKRCAESTDALFGEALGRKYVERYFPPAAKARAQELVRNVLAAMKDTIEGLAWMGPETKRKALEKLSTFNPKIGYPDRWKDYSSVLVHRDTFVENFLAGSAWNVDDSWKQAGKPTDRGRWGMTPPTSNAYYNPLLNEIVFPAGILQPPAFSLDHADAVNYGAIGVVIGHEISHGFDDQGAQFDAQGRLQNWWTARDLQEFQKRGQCVVRQFESYFIEPGIHHNGQLVLGEAIGDLAGAKIAFRAYRKALQQHPAAPSPDGFSPEQEFFIAWGQFRYDATRPETQRMMVQGDPHPVAKYRVIGPLSNLAEFQQAFSCKAGAGMVRPPDQRCVVW